MNFMVEKYFDIIFTKIKFPAYVFHSSKFHLLITKSPPPLPPKKILKI